MQKTFINNKSLKITFLFSLLLFFGVVADVRASVRYDVNQDGEITASDALLVLRNSLGFDMVNSHWEITELTGDVNCDDSANSVDAMLILRHSLGLDIDKNKLIELENEIKNTLDNLQADTNLSLKVVTDKGDIFKHDIGASTENTSYESASTAKLITATIILSLVDDGILSLDDSPQDYISSWPTTGNLSLIKLRHLLSFTSGLSNHAICSNLPNYDFEDCVGRIVIRNPDSKIPGEEFYYANTHLQVAGLMAIKASNFSSWQDVFSQFQDKTSLLTNAKYDLPSLSNPRLAGGMHWNTKEYVEFLEALYRGEILSNELLSQMHSDQLGDAEISNSPASLINEDWHYGFGTWIECHSDQYNCAETTRVSSPGAYGAYPFIDYQYKYFGIIARQNDTFRDGYDVFMSVSEKLEDWALMTCN